MKAHFVRFCLKIIIPVFQILLDINTTCLLFLHHRTVVEVSPTVYSISPVFKVKNFPKTTLLVDRVTGTLSKDAGLLNMYLPFSNVFMKNN
jgi:hypothetical protein